MIELVSIYGAIAAVIAVASLFAAVFTQRAASVLSIIAAISGGMAVVALVLATIMNAVTP